MVPRTCPFCRGPLETEIVGQRPGVVAGWCDACDLLVLPGEEPAGSAGSAGVRLRTPGARRHLAVVHPLSSQDRRELEDQGPGAA
jgi:hypothetical protein